MIAACVDADEEERLAARGGGTALFPPLDLHPSSWSSITSATMSSALPKSDSTTSLLRSSGLKSRSKQHQHPSRAGGRDDPCETSARRPLCQPGHGGSRGEPRVHRSHSHEQESLAEDGYAPEEARPKTSRHQKERSRSMKSKHAPHPHQGSSRAEHGGSRRDRRASPTPSHSKQTDDAAFFFEPRKRVVAGSFSSLSSSDPAGSSAPVRTAASKRLSVTSSEYDSSLHPIVKSVFGQVREVFKSLQFFFSPPTPPKLTFELL